MPRPRRPRLACTERPVARPARRLFLNDSGMDFGGGAAHAEGLRDACRRSGPPELVTFVSAPKASARRHLVSRLVWDQTVFALEVARARGFGLALNNRPTLLLGHRGSFYEANAHFPDQRLFRALLNIGRRIARAQIYPSSTMRELAGNSGPTAHVVRHGVRPEFVVPHPAPAPLTSIFPAWPGKNKRHLDALQAFRHVVDAEPTARLTLTIGFAENLAADAPRVKSILDMIASLDLIENVALAGSVAVADMAAVMAEHSVVLLLTDLESFGLPVIEARSLGRYVLASDLPELRELDAPGVEFVANGAIEELAARWLSLLREPHPPAPTWSRTWDDVLEDLYRVCVPPQHLP